LKSTTVSGTGAPPFVGFPLSRIPVATKTGTGEVLGKQSTSWFASYAPADNPQYTCVVIIKNRPHAPIFYGASVAGPVFKEIADRLYSTYIQNKLDIAPVFAMKDSQLFNYSISKMSLQTIAKQLSIPYQDSSLSTNDWIQLQGKGKTLKAAQQVISDSSMPNMTGMKLQDALWLCEKKGLLVKCVGKGKVIKQSIAQGELIIKGQQIQIELN
jgi:cell division protein FtsI (penicillin-binding protein 3)